ncbi:GFA family protein [Marinomonas sp. C2222]|uniref:GFA family protein n=1 Tax=Marinomonas sargassi TaxID=2984494 RepID=A0ABT2YRH7_9GAMM|nr:GFA family protein [Marinomonas sargassi]MCV2402254.1 GFA family protein [Marinomonas sargassi]
MNTGSCHCKKVVFEVQEPLSAVNLCYCHSCRHLSGAAYSVVARIPKNAFRMLKGKESLHIYESSTGKFRHYCRDCCSPIFVTVKSQPEFVRIRLGVLDFNPVVNIVGHIWVSEKPNWHTINDQLPQYAEWPDTI